MSQLEMYQRHLACGIDPSHRCAQRKTAFATARISHCLFAFCLLSTLDSPRLFWLALLVWDLNHTNITSLGSEVWVGNMQLPPQQRGLTVLGAPVGTGEYSQSVSQACTPRGEPFQGAGAKFHFIHTLHAHWLQKSKKPFNCCFHTTKSCAVSSQRPNLW